jgi:aminoglycoside 6'-N-acetyltransferase I
MVRTMRPGDEPAVREMMRALWPDFDDDDSELTRGQVFVWERPSGELGGFASYALRPWAEGCASRPVPYLEGWWVAPDLRRGGVGRALVAAVEEWARAGGYAELGSDADADNALGLAAHGAVGFQPTERLQFFRKRL